MKAVGDFIEKFLDKEELKREEGVYTFEEFTRRFLDDIPSTIYYSHVIREPLHKSSGLVAIFFRDSTIKEVFSTTCASIPTYVNRKFSESQTYEASLLLSIEEPGRTVVLHGASKLGKSALWKNVIGSEHILVQCTPQMKPSDLYGQALFELNSAYISQVSESSNNKTSYKMTGKVALPYGASLGGEKGCQEEKKVDCTLKYMDQPVNAKTLCSSLSEKKLPIIFENYHRLDESSFESICYDLRTFADENITTIFVGIPSDPHKFIQYNNELLGRIIFMPFSFWEKNELKRIGVGGEDILNISFNEETLEFLATEAAGSPILMQLYCLIGCLASDVTATMEYPVDIKLTKQQLKLAMQSYGILYLSPCKVIREKLVKYSNAYRSIPKNFIENIFAAIKDGQLNLSINLNDIVEGVIPFRGLRALQKKLNSDPLTKDLLVIDESNQAVVFSNPLFVSYIRWID